MSTMLMKSSEVLEECYSDWFQNESCAKTRKGNYFNAEAS